MIKKSTGFDISVRFYNDLYSGLVDFHVQLPKGFSYLVSLGYSEEILSSLWDFPWEHTYPCGCPAKYLTLEAYSKVLNLGSGVGLDGFYITLLFPEFRGLIVNLDIAFSALFHSRNWASLSSSYEILPVSSNIVHVCADANCLPFANLTFDAVIINGMFNISTEKEKLLSEVARILTPPGMVLIADIFTKGNLPDDIYSNPSALVWCVAGAVTSEELEDLAVKAGLTPPVFHEKEVIDDLLYRAVCSMKKST